MAGGPQSCPVEPMQLGLVQCACGGEEHQSTQPRGALGRGTERFSGVKELGKRPDLGKLAKKILIPGTRLAVWNISYFSIYRK